MGEVKWIKITTNMFEDEKIDFIESLPESDAILVIWVKLLTLAGKTNVNGFIFLTEKIPYTDEMLAHKFRRPLNTVKLALGTLRELEMVEYNDEGFLKISNWEKHQNIEGLEKIREQNRIRQARYRAKQKGLTENNEGSNVIITLCNGTEEELELEEDKDSSSNDDFSKLVQAFEQNGFGTLNITTKDLLVALIDDYSYQWTLEAIELAVKSNKRNLRYVEGILKSWKTDGKDNKKKKGNDPYAGLEVF